MSSLCHNNPCSNALLKTYNEQNTCTYHNHTTLKYCNTLQQYDKWNTCNTATLQHFTLQHCNTCNTCNTSTLQHCNTCNTCNIATLQHCNTCNTATLQHCNTCNTATRATHVTQYHATLQHMQCCNLTHVSKCHVKL